MMKYELEERLGKELEYWEWEMAHWIYMNDPEIPDVNGKDVLAQKIKDGEWFSTNGYLWKKYEELKGPAIIVATHHDLFTTWEVDHRYICHNLRGNLVFDIYKEVCGVLKKEYPDLWADCDYFHYSYDRDEYVKEHTAVWDTHDVHWLVVHYVQGGSEGYYVHVAIVDKHNRYKYLFLGKTLREGEAGISWAEKMVAALSRIMRV